MTDTQKPVWDLFIRFFHWTLALSFVVAYLTEGEVPIHFYLGWYIGIMLVLRVIWGFIGSKHARFSDFVKSPSEVIQYAKNMMDKDSPTYRGHNPLGGMMILALIFSLGVTVVSGIAHYTDKGNDIGAFLDQPVFQELEHKRPRIEQEAEKALELVHEEHEEDIWEEVHEVFANLTLFLVLLHIAGVVFSSRKQGENLAKAMVTGYKKS